MSDRKPRVFLSHNSSDKAYASKLAGALQLAGASVWFDAWEIRFGDSIPSAINEGLANLDIFVLLWSTNAAGSKWIESETSAAVTRLMNDDGCRVIPVLLDDAKLPSLVGHLRYIDGRARPAPIDIAQKILGIESQKGLLAAIQDVLDESGLYFREFWGAGVFVCCPECHASVERLEGWHATDDDHDRSYAGVRCSVCGWEVGSEL